MRAFDTISKAPALLFFFITLLSCAASGPNIAPSMPPLESAGRRGESGSNPLEQYIRQYRHQLQMLEADEKQLKSQNLRLDLEVKNLKHGNAQAKSLIMLQARVIQLLDDKNNTIKTMLAKEAVRQNLNMRDLVGDRIYIGLIEDTLFDQDSADVNDAGRKILRKVCESIKAKRAKALVVENTPHRFRLGYGPRHELMTDFMLSTARAATVAAFIAQSVNLPVEQVTFSSYHKVGAEEMDTLKKMAPAERRIYIGLELEK